VKLHIGIDDTDSAKGGCTTYIASLLVERFSKIGARFTDYPNIIRLNPNIPYKTRGNAAVAIRVEVPATKIEPVRETTLRTIEESSRIGDKGTDPAVVLLPGEPTRRITELSRRALTEVVSVHEAERTLRESAGSAIVYGSGLGLVGALSAVGQPLRGDHTYELIAYRTKRRLGKPRLVDKESVIRMDRMTGHGTFNSYDFDHKRVLITPHGPDPVLLGLRGETPEAVHRGFQLIRVREPIERWTIFRTNHGTEAHFQTESTRAIGANRPAWLRGVVYEKPYRIAGGHVFLKVLASGQLIECAAFEPTGNFKEVIAELIPGDEVTVFGGVRKLGAVNTVNLEKVSVNRLVDDIEVRNPQCPKCGKRMKSAGRGQGYKCSRCKYTSRSATKLLTRKSRTLQPGVYVPDRKAQRHLTKPVSRYGLEKRSWDGKPPRGVWHQP